MVQNNNKSVFICILIVLALVSSQSLGFGGIKYTHDFELKYQGLSKDQNLSVYMNGEILSPIDRQMEQDLNESMLRKGKNNIHVIVPEGAHEEEVTLLIKEEEEGNVLKKIRFRTNKGTHKFTFQWKGFSKSTPYQRAQNLKKLRNKDKEELRRITRKWIQSYTNRDVESVMKLRRKYQNEIMSFLTTISYMKSEGKKSAGKSVTVDDLYKAHRKVFRKFYGTNVKDGSKRANTLNVRLSPYDSKVVFVEPADEQYLLWIKSGLDSSFSQQYQTFVFIRINGDWILSSMQGQQKKFE